MWFCISEQVLFFIWKQGSVAPVHTGTMESAALVIANRAEVASIRRKLFPTPLPKPKYKAPKGWVTLVDHISQYTFLLYVYWENHYFRKLNYFENLSSTVHKPGESYFTSLWECLFHGIFVGLKNLFIWKYHSCTWDWIMHESMQ